VKKLIRIAGIALMFGAYSMSISAQGIDVVFKVDESGSMGPVIAGVRNNVGTIAAGLPAGSHAAAVGFGYTSTSGTHAGVIPHVHCDLLSLDTNQAAFQTCVDELVASGGTEPGWDAVTQSANGTLGLTFTGAPYCNLLFTDEPSNGDIGTQQDAIDAMNAVGGIFFGIASLGSSTTSYQPIADATGGQMFDLAAFIADPQPVIAAVINACTVAVESGAARMNGGGSMADESGAKVTHGFELQCNIAKTPSNLQVNWGENKFHLESLDSARCSDNENYSEGSPVAGIDTLIGEGTGRLNGESGATVEFTFSDQGEPGKTADTASIVIRDSGGSIVLSINDSLVRGNHQALPSK